MFVTNFDKKRLVAFYMAIQRHMQYKPPYTIWVEDKPRSTGLRQDGPFLNPNEYSLHVDNFISPDKMPNLSRFWSMMRELEEEADSIVRRV